MYKCKIETAIVQSDAFDEFSDAIVKVEKRNMPNSIVSVYIDTDEIFVEVKLNKSTMKDVTTSNEILDAAMQVLKNNCENIDLDSLKIYLNNVNRKSNTIRLRVLKPLEKQ